MSRNVTIKKGAFLRAYAEHGTIARAAKIARINRRTHFRWLKDDADYRAKFVDVKRIHIELLEAECDRRAVEGVVRQRFHQGEPIVLPCSPDDPGAVEVRGDDGSTTWVRPYLEREYSDNLLMFRLKRLDPNYRDRVTVTTRTHRQSLPGQAPGSLYATFRDRLKAK